VSPQSLRKNPPGRPPLLGSRLVARQVGGIISEALSPRVHLAARDAGSTLSWPQRRGKRHLATRPPAPAVASMPIAVAAPALPDWSNGRGSAPAFRPCSKPATKKQVKMLSFAPHGPVTITGTLTQPRGQS